MSNLVLAEMTSLLMVVVGISVLFKSRRSTVGIYFCVFSCAVALWTGTNGLVHSFGDTSLGPMWGRLTFFSASVIALSFFLFSTIFPSPDPHTSALTWIRRLWISVGAIFTALSITPLVLVDTGNVDGALIVTYGPLHIPFAAYFIACFMSALYLLDKKRRSLIGNERAHANFLLVSVLCAAAGGTITNLLLPVAVGTSRYGQYGPMFTLLLVALVGHAIIRHRFMDLRIVIKRGAVYLAASLATAIALVGFITVFAVVFPAMRAISITMILIILLIAAMFHPIKSRIQIAFERYLYREPYNYQRVVRDTSRALGGTIELNELLDHLARSVNKTMKPDGLAVYLFDEEEGEFCLAWCSDVCKFSERTSPSSGLLTTMSSTHYPVFRDELLNAPLTEQDRELANDLDRLGAQVVAPLIEEGGVIGFLALGAKPLNNPYFSDDADLLATLANQSSVAIRNAQTHQRVVQLNEELQTILSTIESGVVAVNAKARITLFNRAAERLTGVPTAAAKGQRAQDLPAPLARCIAETIADAEPRSQVEFSLPDPAGQLVPLVCSTSPLLAPSGQLVGAVAVVNDISHLKELEHEKRRTERLASIEAIAAGLVHEIRNPLVAVKTFSQLLPTKYHDHEFRETFSRTAGREIRRIDTLLTRFRTLVSASSQPMESIDITDPMRHTVELLRPQLDEREIRVRQVWDGNPRPILGNMTQLEQLFLNLCLNAMEAMGAGGELTLRVADLFEGGGTTLLVEVSDTGVGIPEELLPKIFDPFVSSKARGSGLGLAICRGVADAHRARLSARNNAERPGSTFTIEFPVPVAEPSTAIAT